MPQRWAAGCTRRCCCTGYRILPDPARSSL
jgi:hypothetical protein